MSLRSHEAVIAIDPGPNLHKKYEAAIISPAEAAKWARGASHAGYHYLGCAKTFALVGKAFADANLPMMKGR